MVRGRDPETEAGPQTDLERERDTDRKRDRDAETGVRRDSERLRAQRDRERADRPGETDNPRAREPSPPARSPLTSWKSACPAGPAAGTGAGDRRGSGAGGRIRHTVSSPAHAMAPPPTRLGLGCGSGFWTPPPRTPGDARPSAPARTPGAPPPAAPPPRPAGRGGPLPARPSLGPRLPDWKGKLQPPGGQELHNVELPTPFASAAVTRGSRRVGNCGVRNDPRGHCQPALAV